MDPHDSQPQQGFFGSRENGLTSPACILQVGHALGDALVWEALGNPLLPVAHQLRRPSPPISFAAKAVKMGFKLTHIKYRQEREKTSISGMQECPLRQAWENPSPPSSRTRVGISQLLQHGLGQSTGTCCCQDRLGEMPGTSLSLEVLPQILQGRDPAVCEKN